MMKLKQCFRRKILIFLLCHFWLPALYAQNAAPSHPNNGEFITKWLLLGPFSTNDLEQDFLVPSGGEAQIVPKEGDVVVTSAGDTLRWQRYHSSQPIVDLLSALGRHENATAYAYCNLTSEATATNQMLLGSDDGASVWINGQRVFHKPAFRPLLLDDDAFAADLQQGPNRCLLKISQSTGAWAFSFRALQSNPAHVSHPRLFLASAIMKEEALLYSIDWLYHAGDDPLWAQPGFDDREWERADTELQPIALPNSGWQGAGWFRLHLAVDSSLINQPLGLSVWQAGKSQLYLDGKLLHSFGEISGDWTGIPKSITFETAGDHVLAVRYVNLEFEKFREAGFSSGFFFRLGDLNQLAEQRIRYERPLIAYQMAFTALTLALGLLNIILFAFFSRLKQNLYFALFLFAYAAAIYFDYQHSLATNIGAQLDAVRMHRIVYIIFVVLQLRFLYSLFYKKVPKQFWVIMLAIALLALPVIEKPMQNFGQFGIIDLMVMLEILRVILVALSKRREGAWLIGLAFLLYYFFGTFDALMDAGIVAPFLEMLNPYAFGSIGFFIAMSIYLSRDFARTSAKLAEQEMETKLLEAENARQAEEIEEARQLQLSMLPRKVPQVPGLEIAVFMKTATEVGGDYYDFKLHKNGALTIAIGDATGHGMQAGTMVSATKSLFHALAEEPEPVQILRKCSVAIKAMGLRKMYMALAVAKYSGQQLRIASAGMPYPLVYRSATGQVEEIVLKGMPLGSFIDFAYRDETIALAKSDTVLLMSDGFEEMFNPRNEILGDERVKQHFKEAAEKSPQQIIEHLTKVGVEWAGGREQRDDLTFVVLKLTE